MSDPLPSWRDTPTRRTIEEFVASVVTGPDAVPPEERIAVFDNDGTLWGEKPMPTQLHYVVEQWRRQVEADPGLADHQPYTAVAAGDLGWIGGAVDKHYAGDDADLQTLIGALVGLTEGVDVTDYAASVAEFYRTAVNPVLGRSYSELVYQPMVELLRFLEASGFTCYIVSGGERDFMRPMTESNYGIPPERVVGSAFGLAYDRDTGNVRYTSALAFFDDGPEKPVRIWSRIGRRPILAGGNSNGDLPMLEFALRGPRPGLALLVHHDDPDPGRGDPAYDKGAEDALAAAADGSITIVSVADDWAVVHPRVTDPA